MDIVPPNQLRKREIQEDLDVISDEDESDPFVRPKRVPTQKQLDNLAKGREAMRLKREQKKSMNTQSELEIQDKAFKLGRKLTLRERRDIERKYEDLIPTKKMPRGRPKKVQVEDVIERAEEVKLTTAQEKKFEEIKQLSQEELDEKEFEKFIKMMGKFETMVTKMEEKKRLEQEEMERKERELEERYFKKFMEKQSKSQDPEPRVISSPSAPRQVQSQNGLNLTEEEQKFSSYF